jgi:hypothetical protein
LAEVLSIGVDYDIVLLTTEQDKSPYFAALLLTPNLAKNIAETISRLLSSSSVDLKDGSFYP